MKNKSIIWGFALLAVVSAVLFWFKYTNLNHDNQEVKIGAILPLSGDVAVYGKSLQNGMNLAIEEYSKSNLNKMKVSFVYEDDKADPKLAVNAFQKLTTIDNCKIIVGCFSSSEVLSVAPIAEKNKILLISPTASAPSITTAGDYIFRTTPSDNFDGSAMANFAFNKLNLRNVAIIYINNEYGNGISTVFNQKFESYGGKIVESKAFSSNATDFKSILKAVKDSKADGVYIISVSELGNILKQKYEMGIMAKTMTVGLAENPQVIQIAGSASDSVYYSYPAYQVNSTDSGMQKFVNNFKAKFGSDPDVLAAYGYDLANITLKCLNTNSIVNVDSVKNNLYSIQNFPGVTGLTSFDKNGDVEKSIGIKLITQGRFEWFINSLK